MSPTAKTILILGGVVTAAAIAIGAIFMIFAKLAETEFVPGESVYLRDIYIVADQTLSMQHNQRREAKGIIQEEILDVLGAGDRAFCYRIGDNFTESNDRVFGSSRRLPKVPLNLVNLNSQEMPDDMKLLLAEAGRTFAQERRQWKDHLELLASPSNRYSDYLGTISEIGRRVNDVNDPNLARERTLIVVGDLKHEPVMDAPPPPTRDERRQFSNVRISMVYPGGMFSDAEQREIETFWKKYFAARGNQNIQFISFDGFVGRFPASKFMQ